MAFQLATPLTLTPARAAVSMGFGASPKELSSDPSIKSVIASCKAEQQERFARIAAAEASGFVPGGIEYMQQLPGLSPFGFFDPLKIAPECKNEAKMWREAELMHSRVAMMAAVGILVQESFHPIFGDANGAAAFQLDKVLSTEAGYLPCSCLLIAIFFTEINRARVGWVEPEVAKRTLRENYQPGNLGFDPLGMSSPAMVEKELNNGRLAMIGTAGFIGQELVTGTPIFA